MAKTSRFPEIDLAVAEAIELTNSVDGTPAVIRPSTDLNDAFLAASLAGLFNDSHRVLRKDVSDETWEIADVFFNRELIVSSEDTPELAICAAILKVTERV